MNSLKSLIGEALWRAAAAGPPRSPWLAWFEPLSVLVEDDETPLLGVMAALWMLSPELQQEFALESRKERSRYIGWCCTLAAKDFYLMREAAVFGPARDFYFRSSRLAAHFSAGAVAIPYAVAAVFGLAEEPRAPDDAEGEKVALALLKWQIEKADELFGGPDAFPAWFIDAAQKAGPDFAEQFALPRIVPLTPRLPQLMGEFRKGGVNIYGSAQTGAGEDLRCGAAALAAAGIAQAAPLAGETGAPVHDINIFFMPALETLRLFCTRGAGLFLGRRNIGVWPWSLPEWPRELAFCGFLVDEIWAVSAFVRRAYELSSPVPVIDMPPAVLAAPVAPDRAKFGLPDEDFLFLVSVDDPAALPRANPFAAIRAFRAAFQAPGGGARLVVKTVPGKAGDEQRAALDKAAAEDSRIVLIDRELRHDDMLALIASCDCLVSLHRAEAFGRTIAETLVLGLPVVATHWSGNVDYAEIGEQYLVEAKTVAPAPGADPFGEDQLWAEPDMGAAVAALRAALADRCRAAPAIAARFSAETVGARYGRRLELYGVKGSPERSQSALT
ncbi:glycosyltransferase [Rhodoblastus acidophilus]|uniref:glycosyltransferase n=1 Tax=Candidatus Rhodoblastus alkanivorans TaxID=2954117 RepID=UPI001FAA2A57|nr:glycosyltransferase [Candidatus Rhodoblastus alkanivorans]MDI4640763.1 glycosyltransferase [Rhodoblastus acidophilus]